MDWREELKEMGERARCAARALATMRTEAKDAALRAMAVGLRESASSILAENEQDLTDARASGMDEATLDRLTLTPQRVEAMAVGLEEIAAFRDPVGEVMGMWSAEQGLRIGRVRVPLGVVGIIYEARPNVTADAAGLCLKSGNAVILRGGKEAACSNRAIAGVLSRAAEGAGMPEGTVQLIEATDREASVALMQLEALDVLIPRGGKALKQAVAAQARVPYIMTGAGNCHVFVDETAKLDMALDIVVNAKCQRSAVCNAMETLLVHKKAAPAFVPAALAELAKRGVELRGDDAVRALFPEALPAGTADWETEFHGMVLAVRVVEDLKEAMDHIARWGTGHSEAIVTESYANAQAFLAGVDAAAVYVNASTRFTDGSVFGFGAEMGISTQKLHARGPMGVEQLTSTKFIVYGAGQIRR
ncbi:MAG: glutamate-5-semialdehyde dehydrogenase [Fretibacterium sp.]|nr:glutamate-5-semialdehyde dehydrogenase [Fretibacterium sp.]